MKLINIKSKRILLLIFCTLIFIQLFKSFIQYRQKHSHLLNEHSSNLLNSQIDNLPNSNIAADSPVVAAACIDSIAPKGGVSEEPYLKTARLRNKNFASSSSLSSAKDREQVQVQQTQSAAHVNIVSDANPLDKIPKSDHYYHLLEDSDSNLENEGGIGVSLGDAIATTATTTTEKTTTPDIPKKLKDTMSPEGYIKDDLEVENMKGTLYTKDTQSEDTQSEDTQSAHQTYTFKNTMTDKETIEEQIKFFKKFSRNDIVTIIQVNSGYVEILSNMFCTLLATNPNYLKSLVVWTTDMEFGSSWLNLMRTSHAHSPLSTHFMNDFGVYYSTSLAKQSVNATKFVSSGSKEYYNLMNLRGEFFVFMLEQIRMPFLFLDADMVFFRDPFPWITANNGLGLGAGEGADRDIVLGQKSLGLNFKKWADLMMAEREPSLKKYLGFEEDFKYMGPNNPDWVKTYAPASFQDRKSLINKMESISKKYQQSRNPKLAILRQDPFLMLAPDIVYATDPHHPPSYNPNPYLGSGESLLTQVPKICGGTFYVKPNNRTINLFKLLLKEIEKGGNDQWSMDNLLNKLDTVLVGQLPRCTARSGHDHAPFCPEKNINEPPSTTHPLPLPTTSTLRVRVLDFWQFTTNGALYYGPGDTTPVKREKAFFYTKLFSSYAYLKEENVAVPYHVPVALHANSWGKDKVKSLKAAASWYLDEKGVCTIV